MKNNSSYQRYLKYYTSTSEARVIITNDDRRKKSEPKQRPRQAQRPRQVQQPKSVVRPSVAKPIYKKEAKKNIEPKKVQKKTVAKKKNIKVANKNVKEKKKKVSSVIFKIKEDNHHYFLSPMNIVSIFIIFFGIIALTVSSAAIRKSQLDITNMHLELTRLEEEGAMTKAEIAEEYDVSQIEKIATSRLGMNKPKPYQIVYIDVPKQSSVVQYEQEKNGEEETGLIDKITTFIVGLYTMVQLQLTNIVQ